jgi:3-oxoadipate enol-lactonase
MRVGIATDHGGFGLKQELLARLRAGGHEVVDFGAHTLTPDDDYPDFVIPLAKAVVAGKVERGVAVCSSGVGATVCANKIKGIRACLIHDHFSARQGVEDDDMDILCLGGQTVGPAVAWDLVQTFLAAKFSQAPRHLRRLGKVVSLEPEAINGVRGAGTMAIEKTGEAGTELATLSAVLKTEIVMQTTEHKRGATLRKQRIATLLGKINVHVVGNGPAMVCWPSLLMTGLMWRGQVDHFARSHKMVLIDSPGHGESDPLNRYFTLEECALCLSQILDQLEIEDCILVGNSWGGMMGGVFAALYPSRTRAAILMNCTASVAGWRQKTEFLMMTSILRRRRTVPTLVVNRAVKAFAGATTERTKPEVVEYIRSTVGAARADSVCWAIDSVVPRRVEHRALLSAIHKPVLVVAGEEDRTFPVAETRAMADVIPGGVFRVLPNVGHLAALEAPETVNAAMDEFLRKVVA